MKIQETIDWIYDTYLKDFVRRDNQGKLYINAADFRRIVGNNQERSLCEKILKERDIQIIKPINKKDRPRNVRNFKYGIITATHHNPLDTNVFSSIEYDQYGDVITEDYSELDEYLENEFIPKNVEIKILQGDHYGDPYLSIQLNRIVREGFSEAEIKHILDYLQIQGIKVRGKSEDLEVHANYEYHNGLKNTQTPERIETDETINYFHELEKYKNEERIEQIQTKITQIQIQITQKEEEIEKFEGKESKKVLDKKQRLNQEKKELEEEKKSLEEKLTLEESKETNNVERQRLIEIIENGNAKLADWVLYKCYKAYNLNFQEWKAIAYEGLFQAIKNFDVNLGFKFSTYAVPVIRHYLENNIAPYYRFPINDFSMYWKAMRIVEEHNKKKYVPGDRKMLEEILNLLEYQGLITHKTKENRLNKIGVTFIADEFVSNEQFSDPSQDLENIFTAESEFEDLKRRINEVLETLTPREAEVIKMRYGIDYPKTYTQKEVGSQFEITPGRVGQIEAKALRKLRHPSRSRRLQGLPFITIPGTLKLKPTHKTPTGNITLSSRHPSDINFPGMTLPKFQPKPQEEQVITIESSLILTEDRYAREFEKNYLESISKDTEFLAPSIMKIIIGEKISKSELEQIDYAIDNSYAGIGARKSLKLRLHSILKGSPLNYEEIGEQIHQDPATVKYFIKEMLRIIGKISITTDEEFQEYKRNIEKNEQTKFSTTEEGQAQANENIPDDEEGGEMPVPPESETETKSTLPNNPLPQEEPKIDLSDKLAILTRAKEILDQLRRKKRKQDGVMTNMAKDARPKR